MLTDIEEFLQPKKEIPMDVHAEAAVVLFGLNHIGEVTIEQRRYAKRLAMHRIYGISK